MSYIVKASKFTKLTLDERNKLVSCGKFIPLNDKFFEHFGSRESVIFIYGSYGNGKSKFVCQDLVEKCRTDKYFKCFYGRKIFDRVRTTIYDEMVTEIEERGLSKEFHYSRADNSTMIITHKATGNKFIPFGGDKPDSLKGIKDPSHILCDELDQFKEKDFGFLFSRLRKEDVETQFYGLFNTEPLIEKHWLRKMLETEIMPIKKIFGTYRDNFFLNIDEYEQKLRLIANGRQHVFESIANGMFGVNINDNPFFYALNRSKHYLPNHDFKISDAYVDLSFDFNKTPSTIVCGQVQKDGFYIFDCLFGDVNTFVGKSALEAVCIMFKNKYPQIQSYKIRVTGDASGRSGTADNKLNVNYYTTIKKELRLYDNQIDPFVRKANLAHGLSGFMINTFLTEVPIYFVGDALILLDEMERAESDEKQTLNTWKRDTAKSGGGHAVDSARYLITDLWINSNEKLWREKITQISRSFIK